MEILYRGAESIIYLDEYDDQKVIVKDRIKKGYRIDKIDDELRKSRTKKEVKLLTEARKCGISTPKIFHVDDKNHKIIMEFIGGKRIKELLNSSDENTISTYCHKIGGSIGKLHSAGIVHGDLTTSNMIFKDNQIYFIDFSLGEFSKKIEDQGVDINLLLEAVKSTHIKILNMCWENIVKGYKQEYKNAEEVLKKADEIEKRARYAER